MCNFKSSERRWKKKMDNLKGNPRIIPDVKKNLKKGQQLVTENEVLEAIRKLKLSKALGKNNSKTHELRWNNRADNHNDHSFGK